jgi:hypothetical protein
MSSATLSMHEALRAPVKVPHGPRKAAEALETAASTSSRMAEWTWSLTKESSVGLDRDILSVPFDVTYYQGLAIVKSPHLMNEPHC